ncbi:hypothetical protein GOBAR_AA22460 [Gossypium barbadense]|uniref:Amino acid transporter transmembrane domain-containing protein n=1 Tax=Gossypium barbadense TaxID=3634 RepID=A0A2P5X4J0_GOSBA|nr:hypothetical protein GOBAR_AA22460 [Gossypium barbadense]
MGSETGAGKNSLYNNQDFDLSIDVFSQISSKLLDDDGRPKRTGNVTENAHIITAVIAAGVLSLAWATAQLGWIAGPVVMFMFSFITYYTSTLLAACYRSGDPLNGKRNYTYMDAVRSNLSKFQNPEIFEFALPKMGLSNCFHATGGKDPCHMNTSKTIWCFVLQETLKAPPSESKTMKKATLLSVGVTTFFYMLCRCTGYAAFGDLSPGKLLTGFGFYNPFWLLDIANAAIFIHLVGAYQVYCQPLFAFVEKTASEKFPDSKFTTKDIKISIPGFRPYNLNIFRLVWRTCFVMIPTLISMLLQFFNDIVGLLGALGFWPLTVYFPVEMYISQKKIPKWSTTWLCLQVLSIACFVITIAAAAGSIAGIVLDLKSYTSFSTGYQFSYNLKKARETKLYGLKTLLVVVHVRKM